jgi:hypothetical protein
MRNSILKLGLMTLVAAAITVLPAQLSAQTTNKPAATKKSGDAATTTTKSAHPFHGKLAAVDKVAKTITIGKSTYYITADTKIKKADKPAILDDGVIGEDVGGYAKPDATGKMIATTVTFGPKTSTKSSTKKADKPK